MANTYDMGDVVRCSATLTDSAGSAVDPGGLTFKVRSPGGTVTTYVYGTDAELERTGTGAYRVDVSVAVSSASEGTWRYRFEGSGVNQAAVEGSFVVRGSVFAS